MWIYLCLCLEPNDQSLEECRLSETGKLSQSFQFRASHSIPAKKFKCYKQRLREAAGERLIFAVCLCACDAMKCNSNKQLIIFVSYHHSTPLRRALVKPESILVSLFQTYRLISVTFARPGPARPDFSSIIVVIQSTILIN